MNQDAKGKEAAGKGGRWFFIQR